VSRRAAAQKARCALRLVKVYMRQCGRDGVRGQGGTGANDLLLLIGAVVIMQAHMSSSGWLQSTTCIDPFAVAADRTPSSICFRCAP
jgi:hypothetical protein